MKTQQSAGSVIVAALAWLVSIAPAAWAVCPPAGWTRESLSTLKASKFAIEDERRAPLAVEFLDCLADPDPVLRDAVAFEALSAWLRAEKLPPATLRTMLATLLARLDGPDDSAGFSRPFAALALSEVARADRVRPFLSDDERRTLIDTAVRYLPSVRDYRGFEPDMGWRHGVAHGADLLLQLAVNPRTGAADHRRMLDAIGAQIAPASGHAYVFGESERLARPVLFIARRGTIDPGEWSRWLKSVTNAGHATGWEAVLGTPSGLARRHNVGAFTLSLYANLREGSDEVGRAALLPAVTEALRALP